VIAAALGAITAASWAYWLLAWWAVRRLLRAETAIRPGSCAPPVSILKPVKGLDPELRDNLASFCTQDYPAYEVIVGVAAANDPAIPVLQDLARAFPRVPVRIVVAPGGPGANRKATLLHALAAEARYGLLVASDSDMRVEPDFVRRVVAPLADTGAGLVSCAYRGEAAATFTARLEALYMGTTFLPSAVVAREVLGLPFALGAAVALRREVLERLGGWSAVADYLADDYQLGARVAALGLGVRLSDVVAASVLGRTTFREQWQREVRWARTARVSRPLGYAGWFATFSTPLAAAALVASGLAPAGWAMLACSLAVRWAVGWLVAGETGDAVARRWLVLLPLRDVLTAVVWVVGLTGRVVVWRGERFEVERDGRLRPLEAGGAGRGVLPARAGRSQP
jgi:ceramide glucosyltransferase